MVGVYVIIPNESTYFREAPNEQTLPHYVSRDLSWRFTGRICRVIMIIFQQYMD